jgi:hypothetical protein
METKENIDPILDPFNRRLVMMKLILYLGFGVENGEITLSESCDQRSASPPNLVALASKMILWPQQVLAPIPICTLEAE